MNAVARATGIRFRELPLNPERVAMALKQKREKGTVTFPGDEYCTRVIAKLSERKKS